MHRLLPVLTLLPFMLQAQQTLPPFEMSIERLDPALDALIPKDAKVEKLAEGFNWSEGPTWFQGTVVFSDVPENIIYQWKPGATKAEVFIKPSGMTTPTPGFREQGSNGLAVDAKGSLIICQHGDRRLARWLGTGSEFETLVDRFQGKRFSSPNDLAIRKSGEIYFTDPPYGLEKLNESPLKEISWNGVYRFKPDLNNSPVEPQLVIQDLTFPNGIAFSPDEKVLYIAVSDSKEPRLMAYDVGADGSVSNGRVFFDARPLREKGLKGSCDGMKVDANGNVFATGPGGVLILSPEGRHLGTILTNQATGNCCWGGEDGSELYVAADMYLVRVKTSTRGAGWPE
jgi:gluconolactonase